jgi:hypothetical protein
VERAAPPLGDQVVVGPHVESVDEVGPVGRQRGAADGPAGLGASRGAAGDVDQHHGQAVPTEHGRQARRLLHDRGDEFALVSRDVSFLQIDHDECGLGVDGCQ